MIKHRLFILLPALMLFTGCPGPAKDAEVIGRWLRAPSVSESTAELVFHDDGSFEAHHVPPGLCYLPGQTRQPWLDGKGQWKVSGYGWWRLLWKTAGLWDDVILDFTTVTGSEGGFRTSLKISGMGRIRQLFYWKDEEGGVRVNFQRDDSTPIK